jgi:hypothetical protein
MRITVNLHQHTTGFDVNWRFAGVGLFCILEYRELRWWELLRAATRRRRRMEKALDYMRGASSK